jgi:hypothetical protein
MVARVLKGETIDTAACGDELALRFPDAGMSGPMIAEAIVRAAGMVGMIREGGLPDTAGFPMQASPFDEKLATALDAEIGEVVASQTAGAAPPNGSAGSHDGTKSAQDAPTVRGAIAAVRRAFFRGRATR